ncbi:MAG TPA: DNA polymerase IV [Candidatus Eisenbacteria bacterium]|nr:DNA polymerase IV [Candidatus Eisenbacteria bacterium]
MIGSWPRAIVHIDGDAFFASCEQAVHPEYRGRAVITGKERGIVAAASYEAKALGVSRGTPLWEVKKIIPDAIIVPSDYETYSLFSKRMFEIMRRYTNLVEEYSIDEAFADITGLRRPLRGSYADIALRMKAAIQAELGITVSVGLSLSKVLAKIGSKHQKPDGFTAIPGTKIHDFLAGMPVEKVWGIGPRTAAYCKQLGIKDTLDFARRSEEWIVRHFTKPHQELWAELNGDSVFPIVTEEKSSYYTIGKTRTFTPASSVKEYVFAQLLKNVENACIKARRHKLLARGAVFYLKTQEFRHAAIETSFSRATAYPIDIVGAVRAAFEAMYRPRTPYRATGVVLLGLEPGGSTQLTLFEPALKVEKLQRLYAAVDSLAEKMGKHAVHLAGSAAAHKTPQHVKDRGDIPIRKLTRMKGETGRIHLTIPLLMQKVR